MSALTGQLVHPIERQDPGAISRARSHILGIENNRTKMLETVYREICYLHHQEQEAAIALALDRYWASLSQVSAFALPATLYFALKIGPFMQLDAFHGFRNLHRLLPDPSVEQLELYADGSMHAGPLPRVPSSSAVASLNPSRAPSPHNSLAKFLTRRQRLRYEGTS